MSALNRSLLAALLIAACSGQRSGSARVLVELGRADTIASLVTHVQITITAADIATPIVASLTKGSQQWTAVIPQIPAGLARTFAAVALDASDTDLFDGSVTMDVAAGQTVLVAILAQEKNPPGPYQNGSPLIQAVTVAASPVGPGLKDHVAVTATDPDPADVPNLAYLWTASAGSFDDPSASATNWNAPATDGVYTLTIRVSDPQGQFAALSFQVQVGETAGTGTLIVEAGFNAFPAVTGVTAAPAAVDVNSSTTLTATASDADGDPLTYLWSIAPASAASGCAGVFTPANAAQTSFVPSHSSLETFGACTLNVHVTDGRGGFNDGFIGIFVGPPATATYLPRVTAWSATPSVALGGEPVVLSISAHDAAPADISFVWSSAASGGRFGAQSDVTNASSTVVWYPPCASAAAAGTVTATVTVTNSAGGSVTHDFAVTTSCATSCSQLHAAGDPSGAYPLDPGSAGTPFTAYCDNLGFGGGWALVGKLAGDASREPGNTGDFSADSVFTAGLTDGSDPKSGQDDHWALSRFAGYGVNYTIRTQLAVAADGSGSSGYQLTFWSPFTESSCGPACAGTNWLTSGAASSLLHLQFSTVPGAPAFPATPLWASTHVWDDSGETSFIFGYRDVSLISTSPPAQCVDPGSGQTTECHVPSGIYATQTGLTGSNTSAYGDADGVGHTWGRSATYWIKNSNQSAQ